MLIMPQVNFINFCVLSVLIILTLLFYWIFFIPINWTQAMELSGGRIITIINGRENTGAAEANAWEQEASRAVRGISLATTPEELNPAVRYYNYCSTSPPARRNQFTGEHIDNIRDWKILNTKENTHCKSNRSAINRLKRARIIGSNKLPPPYPNGWYGILESSKLKAGESTQISCLGEHFIVYRSQKKEVFILDAYCPHLGANLGIGGRVVGDNIECPFHKWSFRGTDGTCANIPYSACVPPSAKIKKWPSSEVNGFIFVWYSVEVSDIPWDIPKSVDVQSNKLIYHGRNEFYVHCHIQEIPENGADLAHFGAIHNDSIIAGCTQEKPNILRTLGNHEWKASWDLSADKHIAETKLNHTFILFGKFQCFRMNVIGKQIGPSYVHLFLHSPTFGNFQIFQTITPVEPLLQKVVHRFYATRLMAPIMKFIIYGETVMFERDTKIWNNKIYRSNPLLVLEESSLKKFRKWYAQFYTVNSKSFQHSSNRSW